MGRPEKHGEGRILGAAASLVAAHGPAGATISAIGAAIGAPNSSIYHRFPSRDALLGRLWLRKAAYFQARCLAALDVSDPYESGLQAALSLPAAVRDDFEGARIMLLHRREDFLSGNWPPEMAREAERLGAEVKNGLDAMTRKLFGRLTAENRQVTTFAVLDVPYAAVRRFVGNGQVPPPEIDRLIATTYAAVIGKRGGRAARADTPGGSTGR